jgi:hypothetical protein
VSWLFILSAYHVLVFRVFFLDWYCSKNIKVSHDFVLEFAISCKVARFAIVVTVIVLLFIAVAVFVAKLFLWFPLLDYIEMHWFRFLRLVISIRFESIQLLCLSVIGFAW